MRRREVIAAALAAALLPASAPGQDPRRVPVVGFLGFASAPSDQAGLDALRRGFADLGYVEGRTIRIEARHAEGDLDRVPALVRDMLARDVAVFVVPGQAAARMLRRATTTPVVAIALPPTASDPELFESLRRPGGTITGFSNFAEELSGKRVELLREIMPGLAAIGILHNVTDPVFRDWGVETEAAVRAQGLTPVRLGIASIAPAEVAAEIRTLRPAGARALIVIRDFLTSSLRDAIIRGALEQGVAVVAEQRDWVEAGALISYGADIGDLFRRAAGYADRILKGEAPGELPIQLASKFELVINLRTARALDLDVPRAVLLRADEVIE